MEAAKDHLHGRRVNWECFLSMMRMWCEESTRKINFGSPASSFVVDILVTQLFVIMVPWLPIHTHMLKSDAAITNTLQNVNVSRTNAPCWQGLFQQSSQEKQLLVRQAQLWALVLIVLDCLFHDSPDFFHLMPGTILYKSNDSSWLPNSHDMAPLHCSDKQPSALADFVLTDGLINCFFGHSDLLQGDRNPQNLLTTQSSCCIAADMS